MSIKGVSVQELRQMNYDNFNEYVTHLARTATDWPRNPQTGEISLLGIESAIKARGKRFDRKYLREPRPGEDRLFYDRFEKAKVEIAQALKEAGIDVTRPAKAEEKAGSANIDEALLRKANKRIGKLEKDLTSANAANQLLQQQLKEAKRLLEQFGLIEEIGLSTGRTILPEGLRKAASPHPDFARPNE